MAKKEKLDPKRFQRHAKKRVVGRRTPLRYYLIVTEGEKTEPYYFEGLKKQLPPNLIDLIEIDLEGIGQNTLQIIEKARKLREERAKKTFIPPYSEVWAVFDRDSFPAQNFNNAINRADALNIHCGWSNEAFELWYLLHFQSIENSMSLKQYQDFLERELSKKMETPFKYGKNTENMYDLLQKFGSQNKAIERAKKLENSFDNREFATHNPCTTIYKFLEKINDFISNNNSII
jgi:RloB-like protein